MHGLKDLPVLVIWALLRSVAFLSLMIATATQAGSNESHGLIIHISFLGNFAPWGNKYDPQVVQHQLQEQEAATGSATLPVMSLLWVLLLLLIMPGFDFD